VAGLCALEKSSSYPVIQGYFRYPEINQFQPSFPQLFLRGAGICLPAARRRSGYLSGEGLSAPLVLGRDLYLPEPTSRPHWARSKGLGRGRGGRLTH
jgi:hypothetical protein